MPLPISVDATWLDGSVSFNAQELRRADAALFTGEGSAPLGVYGGIVRHNDNSLAVTVNASDVITVQPGAVVVAGNSGTANGCYRFANPSADTGQLAARNATNPRIDLVVARALDTSVVAGHGAYTGRIEVITGTPAASPVAPTLPALAVELARVTVPATGAGNATVDSTFRTFAAAIGGILPVTTFARLPATPNAKWLKAVTIDTGAEYVWDGTAWQGDPRVETVAVTPNAAWSGGGSSAYRRGQLVTVVLNSTTSAAAAAGQVVGTVPAGYRPPATLYTRGSDIATGAEIAVYIEPTGQIKHIFARSAGQGSIGFWTYIIGG